MEFKFKLIKKSDGWRLTHLKWIYEDAYYHVPASCQLVNDHPQFFINLVNTNMARSYRIHRFTFSAMLNESQANYFYRSNKHYIGNTELNSNSEIVQSDRIGRIQSRIIAKLRFNPRLDDVNIFLEEFDSVFQKLDPNLARIQLEEYILPADREHFEKFRESNYGDFKREFFVFYDGYKAKFLDSMKNFPIATEKDLKDGIENRFKYWNERLSGLPIKTKLSKLIDDLPPNIKNFVDSKVVKDTITSKESLIDYLRFKMKKLNVIELSNQVQELIVTNEMFNRPQSQLI